MRKGRRKKSRGVGNRTGSCAWQKQDKRGGRTKERGEGQQFKEVRGQGKQEKLKQLSTFSSQGVTAVNRCFGLIEIKISYKLSLKYESRNNQLQISVNGWLSSSGDLSGGDLRWGASTRSNIGASQFINPMLSVLS